MRILGQTHQTFWCVTPRNKRLYQQSFTASRFKCCSSRLFRAMLSFCLMRLPCSGKNKRLSNQTFAASRFKCCSSRLFRDMLSICLMRLSFIWRQNTRKFLIYFRANAEADLQNIHYMRIPFRYWKHDASYLFFIGAAARFFMRYTVVCNRAFTAPFCRSVPLPL